MKVKTIGLHVKRTFNLGNFESLSVEGWVEIELEDDKVEDARAKGREEVMKTIEELYEEHYFEKKRR